MLGVDQASSTLGVIPCAIYWLFALINDRKEKTGARFSVRVSAVEITGKHETLKDLLADVAPSKWRVNSGRVFAAWNLRLVLFT
jgi:kinesin family member 26